MSDPARFNVKLFGPQAQLAGRSLISLDLDTDATTADQIMQDLTRQLPELAASLPSSRLAVNHEYVDQQHPVTPGDELALIGMVSGG